VRFNYSADKKGKEHYSKTTKMRKNHIDYPRVNGLGEAVRNINDLKQFRDVKGFQKI